jgi:hypothetical protein
MILMVLCVVIAVGLVLHVLGSLPSDPPRRWNYGQIGLYMFAVGLLVLLLAYSEGRISIK